MLGREPRLPHGTMRWLVIALLLINGLQLVLLQLTINTTLSLSLDEADLWTYVLASLGCLVAAGGLIAYGFSRSRGGNDIQVRGTGDGGRGTVSGPDVRAHSDSFGKGNAARGGNNGGDVG